MARGEKHKPESEVGADPICMNDPSANLQTVPIELLVIR
jgi:hypothetical protein